MNAPKPQPFPRFLKPKRFPVRNLRMTIAMGFWCIDGIMLCADTQETHGNYIKLKQPKLEIRGEPKEPHAVFAGGGEDGDFLDALVDKLWAAVGNKKGDGIDGMIEAMEDELIEQYQRFVPVFPSGVPNTSLLVGVWSEDDPSGYELVKINGPVLKRKVVLESIGCGDILAKYITARFVRPKTWLSMSVPVGLYVIDQAKKYVEGCGGDTQLVAMHQDGSMEVCTAESAKEESARLLEIDWVLRDIFGMMTEKWESTENFRVLLAPKTKRLEELLRITPSPERSRR